MSGQTVAKNGLSQEGGELKGKFFDFSDVVTKFPEELENLEVIAHGRLVPDSEELAAAQKKFVATYVVNTAHIT